MMAPTDYSSEDENYFATMTDMMVGLLFIFLIMVAFFAYKLSRQTEADNVVPKVILEKVELEFDQQSVVLEQVEKERDRQLVRIETLRKQLVEIRQSSLSRFNERSRQARKDVLTSIQLRVRAQRPELGLTIDFERGIIRLQGVDLFASASTRLLNPPTIRLLADALTDEMRCHIYSLHKGEDCAGATGFVEAVFVEGHTDSLPFAAGRRGDGIQTNLQLSARRASNTYETLVVASPQLVSHLNPEGQSIMSVAAFGSQRPIAGNDTRAGRARNRRIDIRIEMYNPRNEAEVAALLVHNAPVQKEPVYVLPDSNPAPAPAPAPVSRRPGNVTEVTPVSPTVTWEETQSPREDGDN